MDTTPPKLYVDEIAPEHDRTSCDDRNLYNAAYGMDDHDGHGRCYRCTLLMAQARAVPEGWQLVPVEPTVSMQATALRHVMRQHTLRDIWRDMLAAARSASTQEGS